MAIFAMLADEAPGPCPLHERSQQERAAKRLPGPKAMENSPNCDDLQLGNLGMDGQLGMDQNPGTVP